MIRHNISLSTNVCVIFIIILIIGVLFSLPFKLFFINYINLHNSNSSGELNKNKITSNDKINGLNLSIDYRSLNSCRNFEYESILKSVFLSIYDKNCILYVKKHPSKLTSFQILENHVESMEKKSIDENNNNNKNSNKKSLSITGHILAIMLIGSALAALIEVIRARFFSLCKEQRSDANTQRRRSSLVDFSQRRFVARMETMQAQKSFEIQGMMHRSPLRLIAARPPPLLRRSSFPALQCNLIKKDSPILTTGSPGLVIHGKLSRRPSFCIVDSDEESTNSGGLTTDFRRRSRLIRRH